MHNNFWPFNFSGYTGLFGLGTDLDPPIKIIITKNNDTIILILSLGNFNQKQAITPFHERHYKQSTKS